MTKFDQLHAAMQEMNEAQITGKAFKDMSQNARDLIWAAVHDAYEKERPKVGEKSALKCK